MQLVEIALGSININIDEFIGYANCSPSRECSLSFLSPPGKTTNFSVKIVSGVKYK